MAKVFLSHSSADKEYYVEKVYDKLVKRLGPDSVVIDEVCFQEGRKIIEEIAYQLSVIDLFVIFLSDKALNSPWVQGELKQIETLMVDKKYQICPIIIDKKVAYDDERIPEWMRSSYNIQRIVSQSKSAAVIQQRMIEISFEKHPKLKARKEIFVGRNEYLNKIEERIDDFDKATPVAILTSGLEGVGRRTFMQKSLFKSNIVKDTYPFSSVILKEDESIEDFVLKLDDLGFFDDMLVDIASLSKMTIETKVELLSNLLSKFQHEKHIVIVVDNGCIVNHEGIVSQWFVDAIMSEKIANQVTLLVASKFRYFHRDLHTDKLFDLALPELSLNERKGLLKRYLSLENITLDSEQIKIIGSLLSGFPEQVFFAVSMIENCGWNSFIKHSDEVVNFSVQKAAMLLHEIRDDPDKMEFLTLLASFDCASISYIQKIVEDEKYIGYLEEFYAMGLVEHVGVMQEYIRINDTIRDYLQRSEYMISVVHKENMRKNVTEFVKTIETDDIDMPQLLHSLKLSLMEGMEIDEKYIIPSIYLKTMNDLYFMGKNHDVVEFADKALVNESYMDARIVFEIRYLLCSALAKLRDRRFLTEVMQIKGADHHFLFGFYYRQIGKFDKALESINKSLELRPNFSKAKREKVQAYIGMQDYESAMDLARINYENYRDNPYHIQAYFACIIKSNPQKEKKDILQKLIENMDIIGTKLSKEMAVRFKAQYSAFVDHDYDRAIALINQAISMNPGINHARLVKFDIAEYFDDLTTMESVIEFFKSPELKQRYNDNIICMDSILKAKRGDISGAIDYFKSNIRNYTDEAKKRFESKLMKYMVI